MNNQQIILRIYTDDCRYRLSINHNDTYQKVLDFIQEKTGVSADQFEVTTNLGKKLNIKPDKKVKQIVYLSDGSILKIKFSNKKLSAPKIKQSQPQVIILRPQCDHPINGKCFKCFKEVDKNKNFQQNETFKLFNLLNDNQDKININRCDHGPKMKCLKCLELQPQQKPKLSKKMVVNNPELGKEQCQHSSAIRCFKCLQKKIQNNKSQLKERKVQNKVNKDKCNHSESGKCLNCLISQVQNQSLEEKKKCTHGAAIKCLHCIGIQNKAAHIAFDQYLLNRASKCKGMHLPNDKCINCLPPKNIRLKIDLNCNKHEPYPRSMCERCLPQNVTIKRQQYRHIDYIQFMNPHQLQNLIHLWKNQKQNDRRVAILYGYYAEDPFFKNGIRAIVQAIYEPEQHSTSQSYEILQTEVNTKHLDQIINKLNLERIGIILTSSNRQLTLTEKQVRIIAQNQSKFVVQHQTGYRLSNQVAVIIKTGKDPKMSIEPLAFMISDQGQSLMEAGLLVENQNPAKVKIKQTKDIISAVYSGGKQVKQFEVQFLLVKLALGSSTNNKFAILKGSKFRSLSRGNVKKTQLKQFINRTKNQPYSVKYGDLNYLLFLAKIIGLDKILDIAESIKNEQPIDQNINGLVERRLEALLR